MVRPTSSGCFVVGSCRRRSPRGVSHTRHWLAGLGLAYPGCATHCFPHAMEASGSGGHEIDGVDRTLDSPSDYQRGASHRRRLVWSVVPRTRGGTRATAATSSHHRPGALYCVADRARTSKEVLGRCPAEASQGEPTDCGHHRVVWENLYQGIHRHPVGLEVSGDGFAREFQQLDGFEPFH